MKWREWPTERPKKDGEYYLKIGIHKVLSIYNVDNENSGEWSSKHSIMVPFTGSYPERRHIDRFNFALNNGAKALWLDESEDE